LRSLQLAKENQFPHLGFGTPTTIKINTYTDPGLNTATDSSGYKPFPAYPFIEMVASFISRNLCRPYLSQPMPSFSLSNPCVSGSSTRKRLCEMSLQSLIRWGRRNAHIWINRVATILWTGGTFLRAMGSISQEKST